MFVYAISDGGHVKIGRSEKPEDRLRDLQVGNPTELTIARQIRTDSAIDSMRLERGLHALCSRHRVRGEWFTIDALAEFDRYFEADEQTRDAWVVERPEKKGGTPQARYNRRVRAERTAQGRCRDCGQKTSHYRCRNCREKARVAAANRRANHRRTR